MPHLATGIADTEAVIGVVRVPNLTPEPRKAPAFCPCCPLSRVVPYTQAERREWECGALSLGLSVVITELER